MGKRFFAALGVLVGLLLGGNTASAQHSPQWEPSTGAESAASVPAAPEARLEASPRPPGPFDRGRFRLGFGLGWVNGVDTSWVLLALGGGYYVIDGLELGLDTSFWVGGDPFISTLTPGVRYVFHFVPFVKPYLGTFYRRYFVAEERPDSDAVGVRGGLLLTPRSSLYFGVGVVYERLLDQNLFLDQNQVYPEITLALAF